METKGKDSYRDKFLKTCGINTLRFTNEDILQNLDKVEQKILAYIHSLPCQGKGDGGKGL